METISFRLRDGFTRFAAEGHGVVLEAKDKFETADAELVKMLDRQPALERVLRKSEKVAAAAVADVPAVAEVAANVAAVVDEVKP